MALRRITGEGTSAGSGNGNSPTSPTSFFTNSSFQHVPAFEQDYLPSWANELDSTANGFARLSQPTSHSSAFNMGSLSASLSQPTAMKPHLSLLTDVGRRYPGFPTPLSPTSKARELFPSPTSDGSDVAPTPGTQSSAVRSFSPMSFDGSEMCGPSRRCDSHSYERYASRMGLIDAILAEQQPHNNASCTPLTSPKSTSGLATPLASPSRCVSPRVAMLKKLTSKQDTQQRQQVPAAPPPSPNSTTTPAPKLEFYPTTRNLTAPLVSSSSSPPLTPHPPPPPPPPPPPSPSPTASNSKQHRPSTPAARFCSTRRTAA